MYSESHILDNLKSSICLAKSSLPFKHETRSKANDAESIGWKEKPSSSPPRQYHRHLLPSRPVMSWLKSNEAPSYEQQDEPALLLADGIKGKHFGESLSFRTQPQHRGIPIAVDILRVLQILWVKLDKKFKRSASDLLYRS